MPRRRFFVPPDSIQNGVARLSREESHHLRNVLRLQVGEIVEVFDGKGNSYTGRVDREGKDFVVASLMPTPGAFRPSPAIVLALSLVKPGRFEWALEKCTELGVQEIVPLESRFSDVRIPQSRIAERIRRWQRVTREAAKQCRRTTVPELREPMRLAELMKAQSYRESTKILFSEKTSRLWNAMGIHLQQIVICIGPEGGWHPEEIQTAESAGCEIYGLGPRILRTETAAVTALAICQHRVGDLKP